MLKISFCILQVYIVLIEIGILKRLVIYSDDLPNEGDWLK